MVNPFRFARIPEIQFRNGSLSSLPALCLKYGRNIVLVTGRRSFLNSPGAEILFSEFRKEKILWHHITVASEPYPELVDNAVQLIGNEKIDLVVGIGGGSVLDAGKAISAMLYLNDSVKNYLEVEGTKSHPGTKVPFIAVPTTSGTGSEATKNAVITSVGKNGFKRSLRHDNFVPEVALVDPELTLNCPPDITSASGMDCFTQLTEAFLSDKSNLYTDAFAFEGLKSVKSSFTKVCKDGSDPGARSGMSFAALTSGICLANAGLGVVHGFASSMGARYDIPHGLICGTLMASANEVTVRELRKISNKEALSKYSMLGKLFTDVKGRSDDYYTDAFVDYLYKLSDDVGLPGLKSAGADSADFPEIVMQTDCKNNPVKLSPEALTEILTKRYF